MNLLRVQQQITRPINSPSYSSFPSTRYLHHLRENEHFHALLARVSIPWKSERIRETRFRRVANLFFREERRGKDNRSNDVYTNPKERGFFGGALPRLAIYIYIYTYTKRVTSHCQPTLARDARTHTRRGARSHGREPFERQGALPYDL